MDDMDNMDPMDPMGAMDDKGMDKKDEDEKSEYEYKDDDVVIKNYPREEKGEGTWFPYYDFTVSVLCRFDISFIIITKPTAPI